MKIAHLITTLGVGGAEKHLHWLAAGQRQRGHQVSVTYLKGQGELSADFEALGVEVGCVPMEGLAAAPSAIGRVRDRFGALAPDVVHTHLLKADVVGALAAPRAGVPALITSKHNDERALLKRPVAFIHGRLTRRADRVIALSDHVRRFVAEHGRVPIERITRIYSGIDPQGLQPKRIRADVRAELGVADDAPLLVCVGRLAPQKDHPTLLAALARMSPDTVLLIVGGDPFGDGETRLPALAQALGVADRARFLGIRHDVPDLLGASDLFVMPSLWEGLGLVFLEAMAVSLPVVASNISAIPEVVEDGTSGWLVPPGDPDALAAAVTEAMGADDERRRRGEAGRARLDRVFGLPRMIDETLAVYAEVLTAKGRSA